MSVHESTKKIFGVDLILSVYTDTVLYRNSWTAMSNFLKVISALCHQAINVFQQFIKYE